MSAICMHRTRFMRLMRTIYDYALCLSFDVARFFNWKSSQAIEDEIFDLQTNSALFRVNRHMSMHIYYYRVYVKFTHLRDGEMKPKSHCLLMVSSFASRRRRQLCVLYWDWVGGAVFEASRREIISQKSEYRIEVLNCTAAQRRCAMCLYNGTERNRVRYTYYIHTYGGWEWKENNDCFVECLDLSDFVLVSIALRSVVMTERTHTKDNCQWLRLCR